MDIKVCDSCKKEFKRKKRRSIIWWKTTKFCSRICYFKSQVGRKLSEDTKRKIGISNSFPKPWIIKLNKDPKRRKKISLAKKGKPIHPNSLKALIKANKNKRSHHWKGGKVTDKDGYILIWKPKHPLNRTGYILEHRLKMEKYIGKYLTKDEVVHHINGNRKDNRIKNLILFKNQFEHRTYHLKNI